MTDSLLECYFIDDTVGIIWPVWKCHNTIGMFEVNVKRNCPVLVLLLINLIEVVEIEANSLNNKCACLQNPMIYSYNMSMVTNYVV